MRRLVAGLVVFAVLLAGCAQTPTESVEPGDGPAATSTEEGDGELTEEPTEEAVDEPTDEPTEAEEPPPATFKEKYTYTDGLQVEVTRIKHGKTNKYETEIDGDAKVGDPYVVFYIRVKNGSKSKIDAYGSASVVYGPDGDTADTAFVEKLDSADVSGTVLPGKARTGIYAYRIPRKYQDDVVMEFSPDVNHSSAIFSGSVK